MVSDTPAARNCASTGATIWQVGQSRLTTTTTPSASGVETGRSIPPGNQVANDRWVEAIPDRHHQYRAGTPTRQRYSGSYPILPGILLVLAARANVRA